MFVNKCATQTDFYTSCIFSQENATSIFPTAIELIWDPQDFCACPRTGTHHHMRIIHEKGTTKEKFLQLPSG